MLDVGCGEGLLGIAALDRVGPEGQAIFSDASAALLQSTRVAIDALALDDRAQFVTANAERLDGVADGSVDAVVLRSVLIYITRRAEALRAFARVMRPGGRPSLFEPLNGVFEPGADDGFFGFEVADVAELAGKVRAVFEGAQPRERDPMMTLSAVGLVRDVEAVGFASIDVRVELSSASQQPASDSQVEQLLHGQGNPAIPTISDAACNTLPAHEAQRFLDALVVAARTGRGRLRQAHVYLTADLAAASQR